MRVNGGNWRAAAGRLKRAVPSLVSALVILALVIVALRIGASNLQASEESRLRDRVGLVDQVMPNLATAGPDPSLDQIVPQAGFDPDDSALAQTRLDALQSGTTDTPPLYKALLATDGRVLVSSPANGGVGFSVDHLGVAWEEALAGNQALTSALRIDGVLAIGRLVPVKDTSGRTIAVVLYAERAATHADQALIVQTGSLNSRPGGFTIVDRDGIAVTSWNSAALGGRALSTERQASLPLNHATVWQDERDGTSFTHVGAALPNGYAVLFEQATGDLYGDLRNDQRQRDITLLVVMAGAMAALLLFQWIRVRNAHRAQARAHALLANGHDLILVIGPDGTLSFVSPATTSLLGHDPAAWERRPVSDLVHPDDAPRLAALLEDPASGPLLNVRLVDAEGTFHWFDLEAGEFTATHDLRGVLLTAHDVGPRKALEDELVHQATHDRLTGLPNRTVMSERLEELLDGDRPVRQLALLYIDLDGFKPINDSLGHDSGDRALVTIAGRLPEALGPDGFVCRFGGDEFGVLLDGADETAAIAVAERLLASVRAPLAIANTIAHLDASVGIALASPAVRIATAEQLVRDADHAMYQAKRSGGGRYVTCTSGEHGADSVNPDRATVVGGSPSPNGSSGAHAVAMHAIRTGANEPASAPVTKRESIAPAPRRTSLRRRVAGVLPTALAAFIVIAIAGIGHAMTAAQHQTAERQHLAETVQLTKRAGDYYGAKFDVSRTIRTLSEMPWTFDGGAADQRILDVITESGLLGTGGVAALVAPDGRTVAASPAGAKVTVDPASAYWHEAQSGRVAIQPLSREDGIDRSYFAAPVVRDGKVLAVAIIGASIADGFSQQLMERGGRLGLGTGGWSIVDQHGIVFASWDRNMLGKGLVDRSKLEALTPNQAEPIDDDSMVLIAMKVDAISRPDAAYLVFNQPEADFYADLRVGDAQRDLGLALVVLATVAGLAWTNRRRERAAQRSQERLDALLQHSHDITVLLDADGRATFVSSAITTLLGHDQHQQLGRDLADLVHPDDRDRFAALTAAGRARRGASLENILLRDADGNYGPFDVEATDLHDHRDIGGVLLTFHDVSERKALQDRLSYRAIHDPLTGLPNRNRFAQRLESLATENPTRSFAVLFVDLDHFKPINDTLGHDAGDRVLISIADRLGGSIRSGDDERDPDMICRLGGDEFAVLLVGVGEDQARATADRILSVVGEPVPVDDTIVSVGATIGIAMSHPDEHPDAAVRRADLAMYEAKEAGRGRYAVHSGA